jgi:hypothetical protein
MDGGMGGTLGLSLWAFWGIQKLPSAFLGPMQHTHAIGQVFHQAALWGGLGSCPVFLHKHACTHTHTSLPHEGFGPSAEIFIEMNFYHYLWVKV